MTQSERIHLKMCRICGTDIAYGFHCDDCVAAHRVCQMCLNDISDRDRRAQTCNASCKEARKRGIRRARKEMEGNVPQRTLDAIDGLMGRVEALEKRADKTDAIVCELVDEQRKTNDELARLNENFSFFFNWLSERWEGRVTPIATQKPEFTSNRRPVLHEPQIEIRRATSTENATYNMLLASIGIGSARYEDLPPEVIAYGLERGKVPPKYAYLAPTKPTAAPPAAGPKAMDVPQFDAPSFDDLEI